MKFWQHIKKIFSSKKEAEEKSSKPQYKVLPPASHGLIERSEAERKLYAQWLQSPARQEMLCWLQEEYEYYQKNNRSRDRAIGFLRIPSVNGFVIEYDPHRWDADDFISFFDFFKERLKALGYRAHLSDIKVSHCGGIVETVQRHYLKPPRLIPQEDNEPVEQLYGNVMVNLCLHNERIVHLKFSATHYNDRCYLPARDFGLLLKELCQEAQA
jgi:hypothetical protein